jgi:Fe-S cluster biosynthesis and repair protein YggX
MAEIIKCTRCAQKLPGLASPPFGGPLGRQVQAEICEACWKAWVTTQSQLINHYGLSTINPDHQQFLIQNMQSFLFGVGQGAEIDTSLQGKVSH